MDRDTLLEALDAEASVANSALLLAEGRKAIVKLAPDHPGFNDAAYRRRRDEIAQIAVDYEPGAPVPDAPYTDEEHAVWRAACAEMAPAHAELACHPLRRAAARLALPSDHIPQLEEVSERIDALSGFRMEPVAGLVHPKVFLSSMGRGAFLSTQYIRHHSTPSYTPEPDVIHELIGHAVQLAHPDFAALNRLFGRAAAAVTSGEQLARLGRVYWYTVEFGVLREAGEVKAYGAGLLSSYGELTHMREQEIRPFDLPAMEQLDYDVTRYQPVLFCADSFDALKGDLGGYLEGHLAAA